MGTDSAELTVDSSTMASSSTGTVSVNIADLESSRREIQGAGARRPLSAVSVNGVLVWHYDRGSLCNTTGLCGLGSRASAISVRGVAATGGTGVVQLDGVRPQPSFVLALLF